MSNAIFRVPNPTNEQVRPYLPGSDESKSLILTYRRMYAEQVDIPLYIGNKEIRTNAQGTGTHSQRNFTKESGTIRMIDSKKAVGLHCIFQSL